MRVLFFEELGPEEDPCDDAGQERKPSFLIFVTEFLDLLFSVFTVDSE